MNLFFDHRTVHAAGTLPDFDTIHLCMIMWHRFVGECLPLNEERPWDVSVLSNGLNQVMGIVLTSPDLPMEILNAFKEFVNQFTSQILNALEEMLANADFAKVRLLCSVYVLTRVSLLLAPFTCAYQTCSAFTGSLIPFVVLFRNAYRTVRK